MRGGGHKGQPHQRQTTRQQQGPGHRTIATAGGRRGLRAGSELRLNHHVLVGGHCGLDEPLAQLAGVLA